MVVAGLGVGLGAGVASGVGQNRGLGLSHAPAGLREDSEAHNATSVTARPTLIVLEIANNASGFFSVVTFGEYAAASPREFC